MLARPGGTLSALARGASTARSLSTACSRYVSSHTRSSCPHELSTARCRPGVASLYRFTGVRYVSASTFSESTTASSRDPSAEVPTSQDSNTNSQSNNSGSTSGGSGDSQHTDNDGTAEYSQTDGGADWKEKLLDLSLQYVADHGWNLSSVQRAAAELELSPAVVGMLENGVADLVLHFERRCNEKLLTQITDWKAQQEEAGERVGVGKLVREAVKQRLTMIIPHLDAWPEALALFSEPSVAPQAFEMLLHLVDDIWHLAGDQSTDFNWYTKRATLAAVYASTELFLLQDRSVGNEETWQFLDRRLANVNQIGSLQATVQQALCTAVELGGVSLYTAQKLARTIPPLSSDLWTRPFSGSR